MLIGLEILVLMKKINFEYMNKKYQKEKMFKELYIFGA